MKIKDLANTLNEFAPLSLQESYDNSGLNLGFPEAKVSGVLLCVDVVLSVVEEAIAKKCNLIVSHHPLIFPNIKQITGKNEVEKCIILAIQHNISIYCGHTNFDKADGGVSMKMCEKLELQNCQVLDSEKACLKKLSVFVPKNAAEKVRDAMFKAGAGSLGNYDECSFTSAGVGSFRANENANPYVGEIACRHYEEEVKIEVLCPQFLLNSIIAAMLQNHPYEEPAYDIVNLENSCLHYGLGAIGELRQALSETKFLEKVKQTFAVENIRYCGTNASQIKRVAVCGGSGASFIKTAIGKHADAYITADIKYHDWFLVEGKILLLDIGHYQSEQFTQEIFANIIQNADSNIPVHFTKINTNPIKNF